MADSRIFIQLNTINTSSYSIQGRDRVRCQKVVFLELGAWRKRLGPRTCHQIYR